MCTRRRQQLIRHTNYICKHNPSEKRTVLMKCVCYIQTGPTNQHVVYVRLTWKLCEIEKEFHFHCDRVVLHSIAFPYVRRKQFTRTKFRISKGTGKDICVK